jgi:hypothetical protein
VCMSCVTLVLFHRTFIVPILDAKPRFSDHNSQHNVEELSDSRVSLKIKAMVAGLGRNYSSHNSSKPTTHSRPKKSRVREEDVGHCFPERRYIVRRQLGSSDSSVSSEVHPWKTHPRQCVSGILDSFTSLCLGDVFVSSSESRRQGTMHTPSSTSSRSKKVVYPIARYPYRLNSKKLVDQRRKSFQHHFFRPVPEDEMSVSNRPRTA